VVALPASSVYTPSRERAGDGAEHEGERCPAKAGKTRKTYTWET